MTQKRKVRNPAYDPLYNGTWEAMGETLEPGEDVFEATVRGIREECGVPVSRMRITRGADNPVVTWTSGRGDRVIMCRPFSFVQSVGEPQLWMGPVLLVSVPLRWEPKFEVADGEATEHRWWKPKALLKEMRSHPERFMGLHAPALKLLAQQYRD